MKKIILTLLVFLVGSSSVFAQQSTDKIVSEYIKLVALGRIPEVKMALPDLLAEYPNDPGVKLLHAVVIDDAKKALDKYVNIVNNYPSSPWADDAYWRIVQYFAITGNVEKASYELANFRKRYPTSIYLGPASDVVRSAERIIQSRKIQSGGVAKTEKRISPPIREDVKNVYTKPKAENNPTEIKGAGKEITITKKKEVPVQVKYGLQVGIYRELESAENERDWFVEKRIRTNVIERVINGETMYSVVVGDYSSRERAEKAKKIVARECDCDPVVLEK